MALNRWTAGNLVSVLETTLSSKVFIDGHCFPQGHPVQAAEIVGKGQAEIAFNISGGLHHAMKDKASGFCYINDPAVAINTLTALGKRVAYIDIDAHHGDGVQAAFYDRDDVLTLSMHERGDSLFPGTGWTEETGTGKGEGFQYKFTHASGK